MSLNVLDEKSKKIIRNMRIAGLSICSAAVGFAVMCSKIFKKCQ